MAIRIHEKDGKKIYEVYVKTRNKLGLQLTRRKKGITSEAKAKKIHFDLQKELYELANEERSWTWKTWHSECLRRMKLSLKSNTVEHYDLVIGKWVPKTWYERDLQSFSKADIHELIFEHISDEASAQTQRDLHRRVMRIFEMAVEEGIINRNPARGIRIRVPEPKQQVLNSTEAQTLLQSAKETHHRFYPVWALGLFTGMRSGEMYALRWSDIDFEAKLITISRQWTSKDGLHPTKNGRNRVVPINPDLERLLKELRAQKGYQENLWDGLHKKEVSFNDFVLPRLEEWKSGQQALLLSRFCDSIGITKIKFHDLRATFITNMLSQGVPLVTVMSIVGHSRMSTTDRYLRLAGVGVQGSTEKLGYSLPQVEGAKVIQLFPGRMEAN